MLSAGPSSVSVVRAVTSKKQLVELLGASPIAPRNASLLPKLSRAEF